VLFQKYRPDVIFFLSETLVHANKVEEIRARLGFDGAFVVNRIGRIGGIVCLCRKTF